MRAFDIINYECTSQYAEHGAIIAAQAAVNHQSGGYSDWFLPSRNELLEMCNTIGNIVLDENLGGFENHNYWSSTSAGFNSAFSVDFNVCSNGYYLKNNLYKVRPIRSF